MAHSSTGPSRAKIWMNCDAFREMSEQCPEQEDTVAAQEGRCGHAAASLCLNEGLDISTYIHREFEGMEFTADLAWAVGIYVDYVRQRVAAGQLMGATVHFYNEQIIDLSWVHPKFFGTADARIVILTGNYAETIDLKLGRTLVEPEDPQLDCYALDLMRQYPQLEVFHNTIVQPRYEHRDGYVRSVTRSRGAMEAFAQLAAARQTANWTNGMKATAGKHCCWCPAAGRCQAHTDYILSIVPIQQLRPDILTAEQVDNILSHRKQIEVFLKRVGAYGLDLVKQGAPMKTQKLIMSKGRNSVEKVDPKKAAETIRMLTGKEVDLDVIAPRSMAAISTIKEQYGESVAALFTKSGEETMALVPITEKGTAIAPPVQALLNTPIQELKK